MIMMMENKLTMETAAKLYPQAKKQMKRRFVKYIFCPLNVEKMYWLLILSDHLVFHPY